VSKKMQVLAEAFNQRRDASKKESLNESSVLSSEPTNKALSRENKAKISVSDLLNKKTASRASKKRFFVWFASVIYWC